MLTRRIIPCLDVRDGRVVKGVRFVNLKDSGDPASLARRYMDEGADELVFLDISASHERRETMRNWVCAVADELSIPFTVGGGISTVTQARELVSLGADKISLNTAAVRNPSLIAECAALLGNQAVVLAVDTRKTPSGTYEVIVEGGRTPTGRDAIEWIREGVRLGCGEILLTSMDRDGTKEGYDLEQLALVSRSVDVPVIASGGAGSVRNLFDALQAGADAVLAASIFHNGIHTVAEVKDALAALGIPIRTTR